MQPETQIAIELDQVDDLFSAASFSPLQGHFEPRSGMEQVLAQVSAHRLRDQARLHLVLTIRAPTEATDAQIEASVRGYCAAIIADRQLDLVRVRHAGRNALLLGLGFLGSCMLLSTGITAAAFLPGFIRQLFGEGLIIAGWVGLWRPVEVLLFDTRPPRQDIRLHRAIGAAGIEVRRTT